MRRLSLLAMGGMVLVAFGTVVGFVAAQSQEEPSYLVISTYDPAPGSSYSELVEEMSDIVRTHRSTGAYKSVRLFTHNWGPESAFYLVSEPNDWASINAGFQAELEANPDLLDLPDPWEAHSDNILSEIEVN